MFITMDKATELQKKWKKDLFERYGSDDEDERRKSRLATQKKQEQARDCLYDISRVLVEGSPEYKKFAEQIEIYAEFMFDYLNTLQAVDVAKYCAACINLPQAGTKIFDKKCSEIEKKQNTIAAQIVKLCDKNKLTFKSLFYGNLIDKIFSQKSQIDNIIANSAKGAPDISAEKLRNIIFSLVRESDERMF